MRVMKMDVGRQFCAFHHPHLTSRNSVFETPGESLRLHVQQHYIRRGDRLANTRREARRFHGGLHDPGRPGTSWLLSGCWPTCRPTCRLDVYNVAGRATSSSEQHFQTEGNGERRTIIGMVLFYSIFLLTLSSYTIFLTGRLPGDSRDTPTSYQNI
jgi:hypothetical protein